MWMLKGVVESGCFLRMDRLDNNDNYQIIVGTWQDRDEEPTKATCICIRSRKFAERAQSLSNAGQMRCLAEKEICPFAMF